MADYVIHGTGKPRIIISTTTPIHTNTVKAVVSLVLELNSAVDLAALDLTYGLVNAVVYSTNSSGQSTHGKILSFSETAGDFLTVESWSNSTPKVGDACWIQGYQLDLPYCQKLSEGWIPDSKYTKLYGGKIHRKKRGFYYFASLDYSNYIDKETLLLFRQLLRMNTQSIIFYPRKDNTAISYNVDISSDSEILLSQIQHHLGHRNFAINLVGVERLTEIPVDDGDVSGGYGDDYGINYGVGL